MRALVVDDEPPALSELTYLLEQDGRCEHVLGTGSGTAALSVLESEDVDAVFVDISMPGLDGMQLARVVGRFTRPPLVVFVTAHEEHAVAAFAIQAVDYVMKPVSSTRLGLAVDRVVAALAARDAPAETTAAPPASEGTLKSPDERIAVELGGVTRFIQRSTIRYAQAQGDYVRLFAGSASHLLRVPLTTLEERWSEVGFVRIHRSTLVNLAHIAEVRQVQGRLSLQLAPDGPELAVARRHARQVREQVLAAGR